MLALKHKLKLKMRSLNFQIMILLLSTLVFTSCIADESVRYAAVVYRHGDRTPVDTYPTDPWRNESLWPVKFGELTNTGKRQHFALGQWLRQRYAHLLSEEFDSSEIYVKSTDVDRTLMSAQVNLAGMYPPQGKSIWDKHLMWQPIPVHTKPEKEDELLAMKKQCVAYNKEMERVLQSKAYKKRLRKYQNMMNYITAYTGKKIEDYNDMIEIYTTLYIETLYNFTLPNWTQSVYPDKLREPACYSFSINSSTPLLARLKVGPLLKEIVNKMNKIVKNNSISPKKETKVSIYSGHDFTIGNILTALGLFDGNCPAYTSTIFMELIYDNSSQSYNVRISYRNSTEIVEPYVLSIPYCGQTCPLERFMKLYVNLLTVDFDYECGKQFPALLGVSFFVGLALFGCIYLLHKLHYDRVFKQKSEQGYLKVDSAVAVMPIKVNQV